MIKKYVGEMLFKKKKKKKKEARCILSDAFWEKEQMFFKGIMQLTKKQKIDSPNKGRLFIY